MAELPSLGTSNRSLFPRQEPCLRGTLSPGQLQYKGKLYREKHMGNEGMGQHKKHDPVQSYRVQLGAFRQNFKWFINT